MLNDFGFDVTKACTRARLNKPFRNAELAASLAAILPNWSEAYSRWRNSGCAPAQRHRQAGAADLLPSA